MESIADQCWLLKLLQIRALGERDNKGELEGRDGKDERMILACEGDQSPELKHKETSKEKRTRRESMYLSD
jgi:hypothetical protein